MLEGPNGKFRHMPEHGLTSNELAYEDFRANKFNPLRTHAAIFRAKRCRDMSEYKREYPHDYEYAVARDILHEVTKSFMG